MFVGHHVCINRYAAFGYLAEFFRWPVDFEHLAFTIDAPHPKAKYIALALKVINRIKEDIVGFLKNPL